VERHGTINSSRTGNAKTHQKGGNEHEEYDGSKQYADVLHVLYVFDMFNYRIEIKLLVKTTF